MSEVKHTPLPWKVDGQYSAHSVRLTGADGRMVASSSWHDDSPYYPTRAGTYSNFRLIEEAVNGIAAKDVEIELLRAQNKWMQGRLAFLQLPTNSHKEAAEWLIECGMPAALPKQEIAE